MPSWRAPRKGRQTSRLRVSESAPREHSASGLHPDACRVRALRKRASTTHDDWRASRMLAPSRRISDSDTCGRTGREPSVNPTFQLNPGACAGARVCRPPLHRVQLSSAHQAPAAPANSQAAAALSYRARSSDRAVHRALVTGCAKQPAAAQRDQSVGYRRPKTLHPFDRAPRSAAGKLAHPRP